MLSFVPESASFASGFVIKQGYTQAMLVLKRFLGYVLGSN